MTRSIESPAERRGEPIGGARWRERVELMQQQVLPSGRIVVSCSAPLGAGGLGRHAQELLDALDRHDQQSACICEPAPASTSSRPAGLRRRGLDAALKPLTRASPAWRLWRASLRFDAEAVRRMPAADHLLAFNGTALAQFQAARRAHFKSVSLVSATAHVGRLTRQHAEALRRYPLERSWATRIVKRNLREYVQADRIYVSSRYTWESFVQQGTPEHTLSFFPLTPAPRYRPEGQAKRSSSTFDVLYVGGLTVDKGVPLLLDAIRRLPFTDLRLILVGGWKTPGMRRFVQRVCAEDPRIEVCAGDPLPRLRAASLYVHAAYCDGFAYAAAEALACGLPVIASEDTGMKELIDPGRTGLVLPTGDLDALTEAIAATYRGEVLGG